MKKLLTLIAVFASFTMWAQTQVSGTVTDADGQPLPGANIVLDGTTGAVSDFDGFLVNRTTTPILAHRF